jgi:hypothetical protein
LPDGAAAADRLVFGLRPGGRPASGGRGAGPANRKGRDPRPRLRPGRRGANRPARRLAGRQREAARSQGFRPWARRGGSRPRSRDRQASGRPRGGVSPSGGARPEDQPGQVAVRSGGGRCLAGARVSARAARGTRSHRGISIGGLARACREDRASARTARHGQAGTSPAGPAAAGKAAPGLRSGRGGARGLPRSQGPANRLACFGSSRASARRRQEREPARRPRVRTVRVTGRRQALCLRQLRESDGRGAGTGGVSRHWSQVLRHRRREARDQANRAECSGSERRGVTGASPRRRRVEGPGAGGSKALPGAASHLRVTG